MNPTSSHSTSRLAQNLIYDTGAIGGEGGERNQIVLGKKGFRTSGESRVNRSIKHFLGIGAGKNRKAWRAAARALDLNEARNPRLRAYLESGKSLTMRRIHKVLINPNNQKQYPEKFGLQTIAKNVAKHFQLNFGESKARDFDTYEGALKNETVHNGTYVKKKISGGAFAEFHRMEYGGHAPDPRDEKVHLTIHPDDMGRAYDVIAPILNDPNGPIGRWKVVDIDRARAAVERLSQQLETMEPGPARDQVQKDHDEALRLYNGAQFTIYAMPDQDGAEIGELLRRIETALTEAGIRQGDLPESDEPIGDLGFSTFRKGSITYHLGDEGYEEAERSLGILKRDGLPISLRVDPLDPGYPEFKATFPDNPFYQSLL